MIEVNLLKKLNLFKIYNILSIFMRKISKIYSLGSKIRYKFYTQWNRIKFTIKGVDYGHHLNISTKMHLKISFNSIVKIGNDFTFTSGNNPNPLCRNISGCLVTEPNAKIEIGNNVGVSSPCIWAHCKISIGNNVKIGGDCILLDSDAHSLNYLERRVPSIDQKHKKSSPIIIGDDVLIGTRCIILKGVTIGPKSIIGSGSVVTKSIPSNCIAVGNPCKVIKYFNE